LVEWGKVLLDGSYVSRDYFTKYFEVSRSSTKVDLMVPTLTLDAVEIAVRVPFVDASELIRGYAIYRDGLFKVINLKPDDRGYARWSGQLRAGKRAITVRHKYASDSAWYGAALLVAKRIDGGVRYSGSLSKVNGTPCPQNLVGAPVVVGLKFADWGIAWIFSTHVDQRGLIYGCPGGCRVVVKHKGQDYWVR